MKVKFSVEKAMSFKNIMKSKGPKIDPCETPQVTVREEDLQFLTETNLDLFVR